MTAVMALFYSCTSLDGPPNPLSTFSSRLPPYHAADEKLLLCSSSPHGLQRGVPLLSFISSLATSLPVPPPLPFTTTQSPLSSPSPTSSSPPSSIPSPRRPNTATSSSGYHHEVSELLLFGLQLSPGWLRVGLLESPYLRAARLFEAALASDSLSSSRRCSLRQQQQQQQHQQQQQPQEAVS